MGPRGRPVSAARVEVATHREHAVEFAPATGEFSAKVRTGRQRLVARSLEALRRKIDRALDARPSGRPALPEGERRGRLVGVRFTADEFERIETARALAGVPLSEFVRRSVLDETGW